MAKANKTIADGFNILATVGGKSNLSGKIISINPKMGGIFAIGDIALTQSKYWAKISEGMSENYYQIIQKGLDLGYIVLGKKKIEIGRASCRERVYVLV